MVTWKISYIQFDQQYGICPIFLIRLKFTVLYVLEDIATETSFKKKLKSSAVSSIKTFA